MLRGNYRLLTVTLVLSAGCSSSSLFSNRETQRSSDADRRAVAAGQKSPSKIARVDSASGRKENGSPANERRDASTPQAASRRQIAEALAAAVRYEQQGDDARAEAEYRRILQVDPRHAFARYQLAIAADNAGRFAESEGHYQALLERTPDNPDLLASLGWSYLLQERYDECERALRDAIAVDPEHKTALYNLGWLYGTQGQYDEAQALFCAAGSAADADRALAKLFPEGRPAAVRAAGRDLGARGANGIQQAGAVIKGSNPRSGPTSVGQQENEHIPDWPHADGEIDSLEQMFARLDNRKGGSRIVPTAATAPAVASDPGSTNSGLLMPDPEPPAAARSGFPMIRPRSGPAPDRRPSGSADKGRVGSPGAPSADTVAQAGPASRTLPDWPYRRPPEARSATGTPSAIAARWGLFVGPGGLLFPPCEAQANR
ncbi:MAG: tetratricopeptide repeat protein [Planctomycetaceae bacterium]